MRNFVFLFNTFKTYITILSHLLQLNGMNIKTIFLEEYVNFVDTTKKQNKYFKIFIILIVFIMFLFLFLVLFNYLTKCYSYLYKNESIRIFVIIQL